MSLEIIQIPALNDNYVYLLHCQETGFNAVIDPSESAPVEAQLKQRGWKLDAILNTHHHYDHTDGNTALKAAHNCTIYGYGPDAKRIAGIDVHLQEGDEVTIGASVARVLFVPGHTLGHIAFYFAADKALFCGDTLFSMGCGRLFEGTAEQMYASLKQLAALPEDTRVFCGHEYTEANGTFALTLEPHNTELRNRMSDVKAKRARNESTVPSTMLQERQTNPFLRSDSEEIRSNLGMKNDENVAVFAQIRHKKDQF